MSKLEIHAGTFPKGTARLDLWQLKMPPERGSILGEAIALTDFEDLQIASPENIQAAGGREGWSEEAAHIVRIADALTASRKKQIAIVARLTDGRKFLATAKGRDYEKILAEWANAKKTLKETGVTPATVRKNANIAIAGVLGLIVAVIALYNVLPWSEGEPSNQTEPTKAYESIYESDITRANTSVGLTNADIAWHASRTYGWDCDEVVSRTEFLAEYFFVTCANNLELRVYPRKGKHPRITNIRGTYK